MAKSFDAGIVTEGKRLAELEGEDMNNKIELYRGMKKREEMKIREKMKVQCRLTARETRGKNMIKARKEIKQKRIKLKAVLVAASFAAIVYIFVYLSSLAFFL